MKFSLLLVVLLVLLSLVYAKQMEQDYGHTNSEKIERQRSEEASNDPRNGDINYGLEEDEEQALESPQDYESLLEEPELEKEPVQTAKSSEKNDENTLSTLHDSEV
jgi:CBS-domain-containing membrane protein